MPRGRAVVIGWMPRTGRGGIEDTNKTIRDSIRD